jgi:hypothetical protein
VRLGNIFEALFRQGFSEDNFQDLFYPLTVAAAALLVVAIVLYNVQTRRYHRHPPLLALQEWLLWCAVCVFGLILIEAIFHFYFFTVVLTIGIGIAAFIWIRFFYFPPSCCAPGRRASSGSGRRRPRSRPGGRRPDRAAGANP